MSEQKEVTFYRGAGNHSVYELEKLMAEREEFIYQTQLKFQKLQSNFDAVVKERDELMELMKILTGQRNNWIEQCFFGSRDSLKQRGNTITECNRQLQKLREVKKSTKVIPD